MSGGDFKLTIELVPQTSWYDNMRKVMSVAEWDKLRKAVYAQYGRRCAVCEVQGRLNCHEVWEYDDSQHLQKLVGFVALCDLCHHVKHIGLAGILANEGKLDYEQVIAHFMQVNGCDRVAFLTYRDAAFATWQERSRHKWHVDLGVYEHLRQPQRPQRPQPRLIR